MTVEILVVKDRFSIRSGVTRPYLCEASNGKTYVVKTKSSLTSKQIIAEYVAACLAKKLGLPIPDFKLVYISEFIAKSVCPDWREGISEGLAFGIEYIDDAVLVKFKQAYVCCDVLLQKQIYLFDFWINNSDRTLSDKDTGNVNLLFSRSLKKLFIIDHNLAFDADLSDTHFAYHIFSKANRNWIFDLVDRPYLQDKFCEVARDIDDILGSIPEEWLPDDDGCCYLKSIKNIINRILTDSFWKKIS
ncbi:HipA family kinase [Necropsobacter massiliensis]|uniref:HipA family kinase n=1 Tax=Necropsobacter massiliensis TaxID=1400001 RepID=UPI00059628F5|nr:HipA family kinase [Necropsobacter massiliensis]